jgi:hypothetical protein
VIYPKQDEHKSHKYEWSQDAGRIIVGSDTDATISADALLPSAPDPDSELSMAALSFAKFDQWGIKQIFIEYIIYN